MATNRVGHRAAPLALALSLLGGSQVALAQSPQPLPQPAPQPDSAQPVDPNQPPPGYAQPYAPADPNQPYPQPPPGGYYQPPPPGYQPPPPGYQPYPAQPSQPYVQPYTPPPPRRPWTYTPGFRPQFGLGLRFGGSAQWNSAAGAYSQGGVGLELLFRALPRLTLELSVQYQKVSSDYYSDGYYTYATGPAASNGFYYDRHDVPILGGARVHLGNPLSAISPYVVGAFGATYARLYQPDSYFYEEHWFGEAQGGMGLEIRGGRHFYLSLDLRGFGRFRSIDLNSPSEGRYTDAYGVTVPSMGNQGGILFNFGIGGYF